MGHNVQLSTESIAKDARGKAPWKQRDEQQTLDVLYLEGVWDLSRKRKGPTKKLQWDKENSHIS